MINSNIFIGMRTHNSSKTLDRPFESIYKQTVQNIKVIVYDDKSNDNTINMLNIWKSKLKTRGINMDIFESKEDTNEGCGKSSERLHKIVSNEIKDNDIYMELDSDDTLLNPNTVKDCTKQMDKTDANILIAGYTIFGDKNLVINYKGGAPHNDLSHKLSATSVSIEQMPEIASTVDSIGWTKILKGNIFKRYVKMFPECPKEMNVCEDFPTLIYLLFKDAKITGLKDNIYGYYKHVQSSTATIIQKEAFSQVRLGFLKVLQQMYQNNREEFVNNAEKHINNFLSKKYTVIGSIVEKKSTEGLLKNYTRKDFEKDFKEQIDCSKLNLNEFMDTLLRNLQNGK